LKIPGIRGAGTLQHTQPSKKVSGNRFRQHAGFGTCILFAPKKSELTTGYAG